MTALYCVFGNPVAHSRSPDIHHAFAAQRDEDLRYEKREAPLQDFAGAVKAFRNEGGLGANVTVPFKEQAFDLCNAVGAVLTQASGVTAALRDEDQIKCLSEEVVVNCIWSVDDSLNQAMALMEQLWKTHRAESNPPGGSARTGFLLCCNGMQI